jgi:hypothetical protein
LELELRDLFDASIVEYIWNVFTCTGYFIPFTYLVDQAEILGIHGSHGAFLISVMGI